MFCLVSPRIFSWPIALFLSWLRCWISCLAAKRFAPRQVRILECCITATPFQNLHLASLGKRCCHVFGSFSVVSTGSPPFQFCNVKERAGLQRPKQRASTSWKDLAFSRISACLTAASGFLMLSRLRSSFWNLCLRVISLALNSEWMPGNFCSKYWIMMILFHINDFKVCAKSLIRPI